MSFLASSRTRFVATAKSQARSFCIELCLRARTNVSCATSSAQSRSPKRRVRYRTNAALYVRKSRSTSVTRLPSIPDQIEVPISETLFPCRSQLNRHAASRYYDALAHRERLAQVWHHLDQLEVGIRKWLYLQHGSSSLVANVGPYTIAHYEGYVAGSSHVATAASAAEVRFISHRKAGHGTLCGGGLCRFELGGGGSGCWCCGVGNDDALKLRATRSDSPATVHSGLDDEVR